MKFIAVVTAFVLIGLGYLGVQYFGAGDGDHHATEAKVPQADGEQKSLAGRPMDLAPLAPTTPEVQPSGVPTEAEDSMAALRKVVPDEVVEAQAGEENIIGYGGRMAPNPNQDLYGQGFEKGDVIEGRWVAPDGRPLANVQFWMNVIWYLDSASLNEDSPFESATPKEEALKVSTDALGAFSCQMEGRGTVRNFRLFLGTRWEGQRIKVRKPIEKVKDGQSYLLHTTYLAQVEGRVLGVEGMKCDLVLTYPSTKQQRITIHPESGEYSNGRVMPGRVRVTVEKRGREEPLHTISEVAIGLPGGSDPRLDVIHVLHNLRKIEVRLAKPHQDLEPRLLLRAGAQGRFDLRHEESGAGWASSRTDEERVDGILQVDGFRNMFLEDIQGTQVAYLKPTYTVTVEPTVEGLKEDETPPSLAFRLKPGKPLRAVKAKRIPFEPVAASGENDQWQCEVPWPGEWVLEVRIDRDWPVDPEATPRTGNVRYRRLAIPEQDETVILGADSEVVLKPVIALR